MNGLGAIIVVVSLFYVNIYGISRTGNTLAGEFCSELLFIYEFDPSETPGSPVEYTIEKTKTSKYAEGVKGCLNIKKYIPGPVGAKMKIARKSDTIGGAFQNWMLDNIPSDNICKSDSYARFLRKYNWTFWDDNCGFKKGLACIDPPIVLDNIIHEYCNTTIYGVFNFSMTYEVNDKPIVGYNIGLKFIPLSKCSGNNKRKT